MPKSKNPNTGAENPKVKPEQPEFTKVDEIQRNRLVLKRKSAEARKELEQEIAKSGMRFGDGSYNFVKDILEDMLKIPLKDIENEWEANLSAKELKTVLADKTTTSIKKIDKISKILVSYIRAMIRETGGKLTPEVLAALRDSQKKAKNIVDILLSENQDLIEALKWALEAANGKTVGEGKKIAFKSLAEHFKNSYEDEMGLFSWTIVSFMNPADKKEFTEKFIKDQKLDFENAKKFMAAGNAMGVYGPEDIENTLKKNFQKGYQPLKPEEKQKYGLNYKMQNDFSETAKRIITSSYGTKNAMNEAFTLKNILMFIGQITAALGIGINFIAASFEGGKINKPSEILKKLKNGKILYAFATLFGIQAYKKNQRMGDYLFEGKNIKEDRAQKEASKNLKDILSSNPGWKGFFEDEDYFGVKTLGNYVQEITSSKTKKPDPNRLTIPEFYNWLKNKKKSANTAEQTKYDSLINRITGVGTQSQFISQKDTKYKYKTNNDDFKKLANVFVLWKIGGRTYKDQYSQALKGEILQSKA